ncbi:hypothetical protein RUND412_005939 [Rhizina undulata]
MTTGIIYVQQQPPSAFSNSSTSSLPQKPVDKSFLRRFFNRTKSRSATTTDISVPSSPMTLNSSDAQLLSNPKIFTMTPSPHTHPLLTKPSARDEFRPRGPLVTYSQITGSTRSDGFANARKMAALALANGDVLDSRLGTACSDGDLYSRNLREREDAAQAAAVEGKYVQEWGFFIKCYGEGRFNVSNPPDPPPRRPGFNHLMAPAPPNESERLKAIKACNISLCTSADDKCHRLVLLAKKVFQTRMAGISFIDDRVEAFKAEHAFNQSFVDRVDSIGAHVLLSNEPMVILDTATDWRLKGNPLVRGEPHLRFYAGAPIVTNDGFAIGTFAVFDTQPRECFPAASRRKLMDFARLAMTEIELAMEERDMAKRQPPTKYAGHSKSAGKASDSFSSRSAKFRAKLMKGFEDDVPKVPSVPSAPKKSKPTLLSRSLRKRHFPLPPIQTAVFDGNLVPTDSSKESGRTSRTSTAVADIPTPPHTSSRPFSVSTASSIFLPTSPPPNSSSASQPSSTNSTPASRPSSPAEEDTLPEMPSCGRPLPRYRQRKPPAILTTGTGDVLYPIPLTPGSINSMAEAAFATSIIARSLNYDLVYLLRVSPFRQPELPISPYETRCPQDNVFTKVLVAHGLPNPPPIFDAGLHLRALRSVGGLIYQNPADSSEDDDVGFQLGILLPLLRDGVSTDEGYASGSPFNGPSQGSELCTGGIVLAAFTRRDDGYVSEPFTAAEVRFLREFGEAMKDILLRADNSI